MKRNIVMLVIILIFTAGFWYAKNTVYEPKPGRIEDLQVEQTRYNEKLITSQILSESLDRVYTIFETNLVDGKDDNVYEESGREFLDELTDILDFLEIEVLHLEPKSILESRTFAEFPIELEIRCTYEKFGKFITDLEKNNTLVKIKKFKLKNGIERISTMRSRDQLMNQTIEMELSTITLKKITG